MLAVPAFLLISSLFRPKLVEKQQSPVVVTVMVVWCGKWWFASLVWPSDQSKTGGNQKAVVISQFIFVLGGRRTSINTVL